MTIENTLERIATALEKIAAQGNLNVVSTVSAKTAKDETAEKEAAEEAKKTEAAAKRKAAAEKKKKQEEAEQKAAAEREKARRAEQADEEAADANATEVDQGDDDVPTEEAVRNALKAYAKEHGRDAAIERMKEASGADNVAAVAAEKRQAVITAVSDNDEDAF